MHFDASSMKCILSWEQCSLTYACMTSDTLYLNYLYMIVIAPLCNWTPFDVAIRTCNVCNNGHESGPIVWS